MRKLIVPAVVLALALLVVAPAALAGNGGGTGTCTGTCTGAGAGTGQGGAKATVVNYSVSAKVTAVDADNGVVTATVLRANRAARAYEGQSVDLKVAATTLYYEIVDGEKVTATFADIAVGDRITSTGKLDKVVKTFSAKRITIALPIGTCLPTT
jgi:hypothetical protein